MGKASSAIRVQSLNAGIYEISLGAMIVDLVFSPISSILTKLFVGIAISPMLSVAVPKEKVCARSLNLVIRLVDLLETFVRYCDC
ncbi:hypothetical protein BTUL_0105g00400 [Botrytis tulipae]|uniref:Uncharacterized protein n=1 Tax=Botrytis tulipae TaxID=87230 RepID=A0A4Z1EJL5_9HELO|nr:hypothetical protein BTUL_0105g00400 [Botrytis tulipae]